MDLQEYKTRRNLREAPASEAKRGLCPKCLHAPLTCYCHLVQRFNLKIKFAILIHGREAQKKIATGRMAHAALEDSHLLPGYDYSQDARVNALIADPSLHCVVLYPGSNAVDLGLVESKARAELFPQDKKLCVFVIDGTWITARKTMQRSENLMALPQIAFTPAGPSRFRVRKQPGVNCFSTIEAIHQTLDLLGPAYGLEGRPHDNLLEAFDGMVEQQLMLSAQEKRYCLWKAPKQL